MKKHLFFLVFMEEMVYYSTINQRIYMGGYYHGKICC